MRINDSTNLCAAAAIAVDVPMRPRTAPVVTQVIAYPIMTGPR